MRAKVLKKEQELAAKSHEAVLKMALADAKTRSGLLADGRSVYLTANNQLKTKEA